jgi:hypothetical protein
MTRVIHGLVLTGRLTGIEARHAVMEKIVQPGITVNPTLEYVI